MGPENAKGDRLVLAFWAGQTEVVDTEVVEKDPRVPLGRAAWAVGRDAVEKDPRVPLGRAAAGDSGYSALCMDERNLSANLECSRPTNPRSMEVPEPAICPRASFYVHQSWATRAGNHRRRCL